MSGQSRINSSTWWNAVGSMFDSTLREVLRRAKAADLRESGHDCGHEVTITVTIRGHDGTPDPATHADSDVVDSLRPVTVRAHNLRDALLLAAAEPLRSWFPDDDAAAGDPPICVGR